MYLKKNINSLRLQKSSIANLSSIDSIKGMSDESIPTVTSLSLPKSIPDDHCKTEISILLCI
jgi:hypothetical protein